MKKRLSGVRQLVLVGMAKYLDKAAQRDAGEQVGGSQVDASHVCACLVA
jgi:hypothetical protein